MTGPESLPKPLSVALLYVGHVFFGASLGEHPFEYVLAGLLIEFEHLLGDYVADLRGRHVIDQGPGGESKIRIGLAEGHVRVLAHRGPSPSHCEVIVSLWVLRF
jgi:hypothetical protein